MLRTVLHHTYTRNIAVDTSGYSNNGIPMQVTAESPGFGFGQAGSRINVRPSASLGTLGCINAEVSFNLMPQGAARRHNLVEGYESFALFVEKDLSLGGTIFDQHSKWSGASSPPGTVQPGVPHRAGLQCDGFNMVRVLLDGKVVGANYSVSGSVRGVGSLGLTVGHWPNPTNRYAFQGTIFEVLLQKYDRLSPLLNLDPCCFRRKAMFRWLRSIEKKGVALTNLITAGAALETAARKAVLALRNADEARTTTDQLLAGGLQLAMRRRDCGALAKALKGMQDFADSTPDPAAYVGLSREVQAALAQFGLDYSDWCRLASVLCLDCCCRTETCHGN
jgi:hypothetical protein